MIKSWGKSHQISLVIPRIGFQSCEQLLSDAYRIYFSSLETTEIRSIHTIAVYLKRIIRSSLLFYEDRPDFILCSSHLLYDTLPAFILRLRFGAKLAVYVHHVLGEHTKSRRGLLSTISILNEKLSFGLIRNANIVFVVNEEVKASLVMMGFKRSKIHVSSNGVDYKAINSVKPCRDIEYEGCFCGRLVKTKGVYDLIKIWKIVTRHYPKSRLAILGDGPEYENLKNQIKESHLEDNIELNGFVSDEDKFLILKCSKVFIFPSYEEGWGIAVAEAMACHLPVVLYDLPAYKSFEGHVIRVQKANTQIMADYIIGLIEKGKIREPTGRNTPEIGLVLDWDAIAKKEIEVISSTL